MLDTKNISPVPFTILRMLTHMAMLLGDCSHPQVAWTKNEGSSNEAHFPVQYILECLKVQLYGTAKKQQHAHK